MKFQGRDWKQNYIFLRTQSDVGEIYANISWNTWRDLYDHEENIWGFEVGTLKFIPYCIFNVKWYYFLTLYFFCLFLFSISGGVTLVLRKRICRGSVASLESWIIQEEQVAAGYTLATALSWLHSVTVGITSHDCVHVMPRLHKHGFSNSSVCAQTKSGLQDHFSCAENLTALSVKYKLQNLRRSIVARQRLFQYHVVTGSAVHPA
jgi:hypothetical protein